MCAKSGIHDSWGMKLGEIVTASVLLAAAKCCCGHVIYIINILWQFPSQFCNPSLLSSHLLAWWKGKGREKQGGRNSSTFPGPCSTLYFSPNPCSIFWIPQGPFMNHAFFCPPIMTGVLCVMGHKLSRYVIKRGQKKVLFGLTHCGCLWVRVRFDSSVTSFDHWICDSLSK